MRRILNFKRLGIVMWVGLLLCSTAFYLYANLDDLEQMAAEADGIPLWSMWQVPFAIFYGFAGSLVLGMIDAALQAAVRGWSRRA